MKEYTVTRYSFDELSETAKEKVIQRTREDLHNWLSEREITEYLTDKLIEELGSNAEELEIAYSLSYCQGDGVAIYGRLWKSESLTWPEGVAYLELTRNQWANHYSHYNSFNVSAYDEEGYELGLDLSVVEGQLRDLCRDLERYGYRCIELDTNEESARNYIESSYGDEFTIDGDYDPITVTDTSEVA
jgi:hypothetical protein